MRVVLVIDLPPVAPYHRATVDALGHAASAIAAPLDLRVLQSDAADLAAARDAADGVVIGPGSPYRDEAAVWDVVRSARERGVPLVGT